MSSGDSTLLFRRAGSALIKRELRQFSSLLQAQVTGGRPFTCLLTDDRELRRLNHRFLNCDYPTDVLSFPSGSEGALGEVAISVERAAAQAEELSHSVTEEVKVLMLHGVLHLLGMDHEKDRGAMERAELRWRKQFELQVSGLIERSRA